MLCICGLISHPVEWDNNLSKQIPTCNMREYCADEIELRTTDMSYIGQQIGWTVSGHYVFDYHGHIVEFCGFLDGQI